MIARLTLDWVFQNTRVPVRTLFENIEDGARVNDFLASPDLLEVGRCLGSRGRSPSLRTSLLPELVHVHLERSEPIRETSVVRIHLSRLLKDHGARALSMDPSG